MVWLGSAPEGQSQLYRTLGKTVRLEGIKLCETWSGRMPHN